MAVRMTEELAQQIVDSARAVVGWNINFIDRHGRIIASTDAARIGTYHKAGHLAARSGEVQTVREDRPEDGVSRGVNYPIVMDHQVLGVIGITGDPAVVGQYGFLLTKICEVFFKEYRLNQEAFSAQEHRSRQVMTLLYHDRETIQQLVDETPQLAENRYIVAAFRWQSDDDRTYQFRRLLANDWEKNGVSLYTYIYPDMCVCIIPVSAYPAWQKQLPRWKSQLFPHVSAGIGLEEPFHRIHESYRTAKIALQAASERQTFCVHAEEMKLALLLRSLDASARRRYKKEICQQLSEEEIRLLQLYYQTDLSIQETAERLCIHKNTLQYRLKKIAAATGLDPRVFRDAVVLYVATLPWF